ncbi:hypothetical protein FRC01_011036, partial [Tulasnella sp. 417]
LAAMNTPSPSPPPSPPPSYDLTAPKSGITKPSEWSPEPTLQASSEPKLSNKEEGFGRDLESVETLPTASMVQGDDPPPEGGR